ncbi:basic proline-rich protein-like [Neofelis nebulosa]|uniref:basic proline-rich protein-like n=1 Tax=Neofelis nebulosa TaxID=61452 RepID=UPI002729DC37|nr:basic proline-rich protein-like [Neofelis nebulosa]
MEEETAAAPQKTSLGQEAASGQPDNQLSSSLHTHVAFMRQQEAPRAQEIPSQSRGALPGLGPRRRAARTPACHPREARTPSRQDCAPPLPVGPGERLASPPPFPPPRPVSPPSPRATGGGGGGGGRSGPGRGSPDLARCDVANQRGPKLRAQPETQLEPGPQPKSKPQSESVASEPGADEPSAQRNPRGAFVRSSRWRATERIPGKARRHRGSTRSSFLRPARSPSCRRQALPCLPGEPTPRFGPGHPKRAAAPGTRVPALRRASSPRPSQPFVAAQVAGELQDTGQPKGPPAVPAAPRNGDPRTSESAGPSARPGTAAAASCQEGIFSKQYRFIRSFVGSFGQLCRRKAKDIGRSPGSLRRGPRRFAARARRRPQPTAACPRPHGSGFSLPREEPQMLFAKSNKDIPAASPGFDC